MATGFISPGDLATASGPPTGFTTRWGSGIAVVENVAAEYGKDISVPGGNPNLFSVDTLDGEADTELVMLVRADAVLGDGRPGAWSRVPTGTTSGSKSGYKGGLFRSTVPNNRVEISEYNAGSYAGKIDDLINNWVENTRYWIRFGVSGSTLRLRFWAYADAEPGTWTLEGTDSTYTAGGWCGLGWNGAGSNSTLYVEALGWATGADTAPTAAPSTALATPTGFTFTAHGSLRQLDGSWTAVSGAATYEYTVDYETTPDTWVALTSASIAGTSFQLTDTNGVDWGTTYRSRVRAHPAG